MKAPIVKAPDTSNLLFGKKRRKKRQNEEEDIDGDDWDDFDDFGGFADEEFFEEVEAENDPFGQNTNSALTDMGDYFSAAFYPDPYCNISASMEAACLELSILELWANDGQYDEQTDEAINNLTIEEVINKVNDVKTSGVFLIERNFTSLLSGITRDENGRIIGAKAAVINWLGKMNTTSALSNPVKGRGEPISQESLIFEGEMIKIMLNTSDYPKGLASYPNVKRSFGDIAGATILGDVGVMAVGYMIVFVYVMVMLGRFNCLELRSNLTVAGIMGVIMGIVVSYGFCSAVGLFFGPMHSVLPFLLLGIGIDDMFVIVQCWDTLEAKRRSNPNSHLNAMTIHERMGENMSHAGV